jgi:hypothetical protein
VELFNLALAVIGLFVFEVAAWRWGVDSTDGPDSPEWERRRFWPGPREGGR